ncbi:MAG TPA: hypothetical protein VH597_01180 [Verrucomicrobiae bacterium]|jgi:hypothetical protein|nr:hypothetical protein [Verrucomicrobiae bacterium]
MSKFEEKKKLLAAESEVYRQLLKLELQTFKVYGIRTKRRLRSFGTYAPLVMSSLPLVSGLFQRKGGFSLKRIGSLVFLGWKTYQRFSPLFGQKKRETAPTAAEEYLSKRL